MSRPDYIAVGVIRRPHGLAGEVQLDVLTDDPEARFRPGATLWLGDAELRPDRPPRPVTVTSVRSHDRRLLVRLADAADRDAAAALGGLALYVPTADALPLEEDSYYPHDLIGLAVVTTDGRAVGRVVDLMNAGAGDILVVRGDGASDGGAVGPGRRRGRDVLVPMIADVIEGVDLAAGRIVIVPLPGLLDEE